jgi:D-alanyl-D-alanine carboxypeptidase
MERSPFLEPRGRGHTRRPRHRALATAVAVALVALAGALAALLLVPSAKVHGHARGRTAPAHTASAPALSPAGLPLAPAAFTLRGVGHPRADPISFGFRSPPRAGLLFDLSSGRVLWQRNPHLRLPIASLTKMMTALVAVESEPPAAHVLITRQAIGTNGSKVGVLPLGRHVRFESMLYGLLLPSGNDAAVAIAQRVAGSVGSFVARMNAQAARLGLGCTRFSSPHGFYDAGNFSCAADLAVLAHEDLAQPRIARVARTSSAALPFPIKGGKLYLVNNNPLMLYGYPGVTGLKTGYTVAAGRCLVATAERHGVRLGVVLLHSPAPASQAGRLLDRAFELLYHQRPLHEPAIPAQA